MIKILKSDSTEYQSWEKQADLHDKCAKTAKKLTSEMIEGSTPICYQVEQYRKDDLEDLTRFLYRCLKLY